MNLMAAPKYPMEAELKEAYISSSSETVFYTSGAPFAEAKRFAQTPGRNLALFTSYLCHPG